MTAKAFRTAALLVLLGSVPVGAQQPECGAAQQDLHCQCDPQSVLAMDQAALDTYAAEWRLRHPLVALRSLKDQPVAAALQSIRDDVAQDAAIPATPRQTLIEEIDAMRRWVLARAEGRSVPPMGDRFNPDLDVNGEFVLLFGNRLRVLSGDPIGQRRAICWRAITVQQLVRRFTQPGREAVAASLKEKLALWDNYIRHGYSQMPWELWVNGRWGFDTDALEPPRRQLVLLHPSIGLEVGGSAWDRLRRLDVALLEPAGYLRYRPDRTDYYGAALVTSLASDANSGAGILIHINRRMRAGYIWRRGQDGVLVSFDLYKLIEPVPDQLRRARERVASLLP